MVTLDHGVGVKEAVFEWFQSYLTGRLGVFFYLSINAFPHRWDPPRVHSQSSTYFTLYAAARINFQKIWNLISQLCR